MKIITTVRSAGAKDVPAITQLLAQLGYPAAPGSVSSMLGSMIGARDTVEHLSRYAAVLDRVRILEVTGGVDFSALVDVVGDLLAK